VTRIQVDNKVRDRLFRGGGRRDLGLRQQRDAELVATGVKAHFILFSDYGSLITALADDQPRRVAEEPQLCAAFVDGMMQGLKPRFLDPGEAIKVFFKQVPEMALATQAREQIRVGTGILAYVNARDVIKTNGMGYMEPKDYESMTDLVMKYLAKEGDQRPRLLR